MTNRRNYPRLRTASWREEEYYRTIWKQELLDSAVFNTKQKKILKHGPQSLTDGQILGALYTRSKKIKGIREPATPNCQSSFREWEKRLAQGEFYVLIEDDVLYPDW